jgi:hypothetical protein
MSSPFLTTKDALEGHDGGAFLLVDAGVHPEDCVTFPWVTGLSVLRNPLPLRFFVDPRTLEVGPGLHAPALPPRCVSEPARYLFVRYQALIVKYQDFVTTFPAASVATILTVFLLLETFGEL